MEFVLTELSNNGGLVQAISHSSTASAERRRLVRSIAARHGHRHKPLNRETRLEIRHYRQNDTDDIRRKKVQILDFQPKTISSNRVDPFQTWVRDVSPLEEFLATHYIKFVFDHGYTACRQVSRMGGLFPHIKSNWIPWLLAHAGLLSGVLFASCHNLVMLIPEDTVYPLLVLKYKADCLRALRKALSQEDQVPSDTTIALTFMLCVEEYLDGNMGENCLHNQGIKCMVSLRGLDDVRGPSGALGLLLRRCNALKINLDPQRVNEN